MWKSCCQVNKVLKMIISQLRFLGHSLIRVGPFCPTFEFSGLFSADLLLLLLTESWCGWGRECGNNFFPYFSCFSLRNLKYKIEKRSFSYSFSPTWFETTDMCTFHDLANQTIDFIGIQSNLQSTLNYRSDNKRLERSF